MIIDLEAIEDGVFDWLKACSGLSDDNISHSHLDGNDPAGEPYLTITLWDSGDTLGMHPEQSINEDGEPTQIEHWRIEGTIDTWGVGARQLMLTIKSNHLLPSYYQILQNADLDGDIRGMLFIPGLKSRGWEEHAQATLIIRLRTDSTDEGAPDSEGAPQPLGYFESISYSAPEAEPHPLTETVIEQAE